MSDVADMLGLSAKGPAPTASEEALKIMGDKAKMSKPAKKPKGMSREVYDLLGKDGLVPSIQGNVTAPNFKNKRLNAMKGKWVWTPITSSARQNNQPVFFHWIKAEQAHVDYPYATFNAKFDSFDYTNEEYNSFLVSESWSKEDTDALVAVCHQFDMRWSIIADRLELSVVRPVEEMQARYYTVRATVKSKREQQQSGAVVVKAEGEMLSGGFNVEQERKRRHAQDMLFKKTKEDELEESQLRDELKAIDAALKKNKKAKLAQQPAVAVELAAVKTEAASGATSSAAAASVNASGPARSILNAAGAGSLDATGKAVSATAASAAAAATAALGPQQGLPALQSSRLFCGIVPPVNLTGGVGEIGVTRLDTGQSGASLSKKMLQKMNLYLRELDIPENPLPTKAVCDLVEQVKLSTVTLLSMHNALGRKEKELQLLLSGADPAVVLNESSTAPRSKAAPRSQAKSKAAAQAASATVAAAAPASPAIIKQEVPTDGAAVSFGVAAASYFPENTAMDVETY